MAVSQKDSPINWGATSTAYGLDLGSSMLSGGLSFGMNARAASKSWDRQKNWATRGPGYMMTGLRDAGLNPILAATGGFSPGSSRAPQASPASIPQSNKGVQALMMKKQMGLIDAQTGQAEANKAQALEGAQANKMRALRDQVEAELRTMDSPRASALAEYFKSPKGKDTLRLMMENQASPQNVWRAGGMGLQRVLDNIPPALKRQAKNLLQAIEWMD